MKLSIILPIYNQQDHIETLVKMYSKLQKKVLGGVEILFIVNGSRDNSYKKLKEVSSHFVNIHVSTIVEGGWGRAVKYGLEKAKGEYLCYTNSARTDIFDILTVYQSVLKHPDSVVKVNRHKRENMIRVFGSWIFNVENTLLHGFSFSDINGTPKIFSKKTYRTVVTHSNGDLFDAEFLVYCKKNHIPIINVPIVSKKRLGGASTTNISSAINLYIGAFLLRFKNHD